MAGRMQPGNVRECVGIGYSNNRRANSAVNSDNHQENAACTSKSKQASFERLEKLVDQANKRDPDLQGLYIYNDFFSYAILDLIDKTLSTIHTLVTKKQWLDAWRALDALTRFKDNFYVWTSVDHGERVEITEQVFGALIVTTIRALDKAGQLNETIIPDLELSLMNMSTSGQSFSKGFGCDTCYHKVLKGYGAKLFGSRTNEEREQAKKARDAAFEAFVKSLSRKEREDKGYELPGEDDDDDDEEDEDEDEDGDGSEDEDEEGKDKGTKIWYGKATPSDAEKAHWTFRLPAVWKEYKSCLAGCPRAPLRGPPFWDLTKWSAADKNLFSLDESPTGSEFGGFF